MMILVLHKDIIFWVLCVLRSEYALTSTVTSYTLPAVK